VDKKYKESITILSNFVKHKMNYMQQNDKIGMTLDEAYLRLRALKF